MYFESHAHYDDERYCDDREQLIASLKEAGVNRVINIGADMASSLQSIHLAERYPFFYAAVGVHPDEVAALQQTDIEKLAQYAAHEKVVAIGEIGLDYSREHNKDLQKFWFKEQLKLAKELNLPVVVHSRDACNDTFEIIKQSGISQCVLHCFSGSKELAIEYTKLGFYIGVGGIVTFKNARRLIESVEAVAMEHILIETDCPYLAPEPKRGTRNDSTNLKYIVDRIAAIKNITHEEVASQTHANAQRLFFKGAVL